MTGRSLPEHFTNNSIGFLLLTAILFAFASCRKPKIAKTADTTSQATSTVVVPDSVVSAKDSATTENPMSALKVNNIDFRYLTAKSKFSFQSGEQNIENTNVNIRMRKDSIIWLSITGVGFEVGRGIITPDSIVFIDKFHKDFFVFNYEQLSKQYNFKLDFNLLQSVVLGNLPFAQESGDSLTKENGQFRLSQQKDHLLINNFIDETSLKLTKLKAVDGPTSANFALDYADFKPVGQSLFPFTSLINLIARSQKDGQIKNTKIQLKHSRVETSDQNPGFPFSVPSSYTRKR